MCNESHPALLRRLLEQPRRRQLHRDGSDRSPEPPAIGGAQVSVAGQSSARVGGPTPAARNLLAACGAGISLVAPGIRAHRRQGNLSGTDRRRRRASRRRPVPATTFAINVNGSGSTAPDNVIAGGSNGFSVNGSGHTFRGNFIGTDVTGTQRLELGEHGFSVTGTDHTIGGSLPGQGNVIAAAVFYEGLRLATDPATSSTETSSEPTSRARSTSGTTVPGSTSAATDITIGGTAPARATRSPSTASTFGGGGIVVSGQQVRIRGNRIYSNVSPGVSGGLGIDLPAAGNFGVDAERPGRRRRGSRTASRTIPS